MHPTNAIVKKILFMTRNFEVRYGKYGLRPAR
jgi:hypothetical protein